MLGIILALVIMGILTFTSYAAMGTGGVSIPGMAPANGPVMPDLTTTAPPVPADPNAPTTVSDPHATALAFAQELAVRAKELGPEGVPDLLVGYPRQSTAGEVQANLARDFATSMRIEVDVAGAAACVSARDGSVIDGPCP
jgi:hypothetical protein